MFHRLLPLTVLAAILVGCSKKKDEPGGGNGTVGVDSDPNATYVLKLRAPRTGDRIEVVQIESNNTEVHEGQKTEKQKMEKRFEYTEHILAMPEGQPSPTSVTRTYKEAKRTDFKTKELKSLPYEGKTITIEKTPTGVKCTIDGKAMAPYDSFELESEFLNASKDNIKTLLPKQGVKIGETWNVDPAALQAMGGGGISGFDMTKSKLVCKLARAYSHEGKQWASIAFDFDLYLDPAATAKKGQPGEGSMKVEGTFDTVVDDSARDGTMKGSIQLSFSGKEKGGTIGVKVDGTMMKSIKSVK